MSSFRPSDMASVEMPVPTGQLVITIQVPIQATTNINTKDTNPLVNATNKGACGHPTYHELGLFLIRGKEWLEFGASQNRVWVNHVGSAPGAGDDAIECPMIELLGCVDRIWQCLGIEWWMGTLCHLECVPCSEEDLLWEPNKGEWVPPWVDTEWIDPSRKGQVISLVPQTSSIYTIMGFPNSWRPPSVDRTGSVGG